MLHSQQLRRMDDWFNTMNARCDLPKLTFEEL